MIISAEIVVQIWENYNFPYFSFSYVIRTKIKFDFFRNLEYNKITKVKEEIEMETPRDITYCANLNCEQKCERNLKFHDFRGAPPYSCAMFGPDKSGKCPCFMSPKA